MTTLSNSFHCEWCFGQWKKKFSLVFHSNLIKTQWKFCFPLTKTLFGMEIFAKGNSISSRQQTLVNQIVYTYLPEEKVQEE